MNFENMPLFDEVAPNLFMGGTSDLATIDKAQELKHFDGQNEFDCIVTLYAWAAPANWGVEERRFGFPDAELNEEYLPIIIDLAQWAYEKWQSGLRVNIRCQAGLNRSGLVTVLVLMMAGLSADSAIDRIREIRSTYALCNGEFEHWLLAEASKYIDPKKLTKRSA